MQSLKPARVLFRPSSIEEGATWYVVRTNPRCEERAMSGLIAAGFHAYLPRGSKLLRRRHVKALQRVAFPLLTGYLFVGMPSRPDFFALRQIDGVGRLLGRQMDDGSGGVVSRYVAVPSKEIRELHRLEEDGTFSQPDPDERPFAPMDRVIVKAGPFAGMEFSFDDYFGKGAARIVGKLFGALHPIQIPLVDLKKAA